MIIILKKNLKTFYHKRKKSYICNFTYEYLRNSQKIVLQKKKRIIQ